VSPSSARNSARLTLSVAAILWRFRMVTVVSPRFDPTEKGTMQVKQLCEFLLR
jgi:hypothetical protein